MPMTERDSIPCPPKRNCVLFYAVICGSMIYLHSNISKAMSISVSSLVNITMFLIYWEPPSNLTISYTSLRPWMLFVLRLFWHDPIVISPRNAAQYFFTRSTILFECNFRIACTLLFCTSSKVSDSALCAGTYIQNFPSFYVWQNKIEPFITLNEVPWLKLAFLCARYFLYQTVAFFRKIWTNLTTNEW